jgi:hypothetical protein
MLTDVEGVEILAQCHEDAAMIRVLLGDPEPEHVAVEPLRSFLVGDPQIDVPDAGQLDHFGYPMRMRAQVRPVRTARQAEWLPSPTSAPSNRIASGDQLWPSCAETETC